MAAAPDATIKFKLPAALAVQGFTLRPEAEADIPFLRRLYVSTRWKELAQVIDWSETQKVAFLESQFEFQRRHYRTQYEAIEFAVLEQDGVPAGRLYIDWQANAICIVDISLLPEWRGHGTGTALLRAVCDEARAPGKKVTISVEKFNPAQQLYRRLGFREVADTGVYWTMEWSAAGGESSSTVS
jgi:GNAT superfamily N-acetyltransferase